MILNFENIMKIKRVVPNIISESVVAKLQILETLNKQLY